MKVLEPRSNRIAAVDPPGRLRERMSKTPLPSLFESNRGMILDSVAALGIQRKNRILELGPGNGAHLYLLLQQASELKYFGLDISERMIAEAKRLNSSFLSSKSALFSYYDGKHIPYVQNLFDRILTVNTIYFWSAPEVFLNELHRVLKPGGKCVISFIEGNCMAKLPLVDNSFTLYDIPKFIRLVSATPFKNIDVQTRSERVKSESEGEVVRDFLVVTLQKAKKKPRIES
ncbi:MAG: methyltransferase domain-containing protein [Bacteroidota bacterium]